MILGHRTTAALLLLVVLVASARQTCAGPLGSQVRSSSGAGVQALRRVARMTPLWRIMNSKPFGAYCQNNYECSTGICRAGHCSTRHHSPSEPVKY